MRNLFAVFFLFVFSFSGVATNIVDVHKPWPVIEGIPATVKLKLSDDSLDGTTILVRINDAEEAWKVEGNTAKGDIVFEEDEKVWLRTHSQSFLVDVNPVPLWLSVLPPLIAILLALVFKEVYISLFFGIFSGAFIINYYSDMSLWTGLQRGLFSTADTYFVDALKDSGHVSIIIFSMLIGGMVSIIHKNGGMQGLVDRLAKYAKSPRSGQLITWFLGVFIFFDDYANTLVVGNTMRPVTDRLKVSREKLAYIVDSTAAPIASIAFVTTWIGAELSYIKEGLIQVGIDQSAYSIFLSSLKYSFYPVFTVIFVLMIILMRKDFGVMHLYEQMARKDTETSRHQKEHINSTHWINGIVPVMVIILGTIAGLIVTGFDPDIWHSDLSLFKRVAEIIGEADSFVALLWSSLAGVIVAVILSVGQRILTLQKTMDALLDGFKSMLPAITVLVLAWSLAEITTQLHTATFISKVLINFKLAPWLMPAITFIMAALVAFSTGSSWGTMAILYPLILPATWLICHNDGLDPVHTMAIFTNVVSVVLAGSVMGDHCSPISDTTIMSSLASGCHHINHVKSQMPYALTVGLIAILFGTIPSAIGIPVLPLMIAGIIVIYFTIKLLGKKVV
ncbi:Na+/H+ antiporter NhaC family protein [Saccharicrinis sp. FJH62]|uniref:Na+/H+ antiporter NhaC family protein n=1 Tax=Saccharicrinis sp. FJH62 TaxID=3344657 RepID=UPI0035D41927